MISMAYISKMAERAGFEPAIRFPVYTLSRRAPSTTRPPLHSRLIFINDINHNGVSSNSGQLLNDRFGAEYSYKRRMFNHYFVFH